ncbi:MAG: Gfo/Idh/MocA family oxidoreductase [Pseudomonadota bacterium]
MSKATLSGVVIGLGHMGAHHLRRLAAREDVRVRAVDPPKGLTSPIGRPDFAVVAVPTSAHLEVALPLLEAGIPCLVEKPLAATVEQASRLVGFPHCLPGHVERFNPVFSVIGEVPVRYLQAERMAPPTGRDRDVDVVRDLMIHDLDLVLWLLGGQVTDLRTVGLTLPGWPGGEPGAIDIANVRLETAAGGVATLTASRVSRRSTRRMRLFTDDDYWSLDLGERRAERVRWSSGELDASPVAVPSQDPLDAEHDALLAYVRGVRAFPITAEDGLLALDLAERVAQSTLKKSPHARPRGAGPKETP